MAGKKFQQELAALEELRRAGDSPATAAALAKALRNRSNFLVAKAAQIVCQLGLQALIPDLVTALDRHHTDPVKSDPQCWAKHAIVQALGELGHLESTVYLRGLRHVQMEPVWGGQEDSAGRLRAASALALVACRDLSDGKLLGYLVEALVDADKTVRVETARAISRMNRPEAALLLRLRALTGDAEPEVTGACFSGVLAIEGEEAIAFVSRFLEAGDDTSAEAAMALGTMRHAQAFPPLEQRWRKRHDAGFGAILLTAMALSRQPRAQELLLGLVESDSVEAAAALEALAAAQPSEEVLAQIAAAVERGGNDAVRALFEKKFSRTVR